MSKQYEVIIRVLLAETTEDPAVEQAWRTEEIHILGTLEDLTMMLNTNGASQTAKTMALRLLQQERQGAWVD